MDYKNPITKLVPIGKSLDEIPANGVNTTVPPDKVKEFVKNYLNQVKRSGAAEIFKMVEVKGEGEAATFRLKNRDVDYYIVGIHGPAFDEEGGASNLGRMLLTAHIFMFTLGTSPYWTTVPADTEIQVYDKNLNLISQRIYKSRYTRLTAWWGNEAEGSINNRAPDEFTPKLYEPDLRDFYNELPTLLTSPK